MMKTYRCEFSGMVGYFHAATRSKARYKAYLAIRETWKVCITEIRVTRASIPAYYYAEHKEVTP
jgi:hypothetical protein